MKEYDVAIVGSNLCGISLANLLKKNGKSVVVVNDNSNGDASANGDIAVRGSVYNVAMSYLHDVNGMASFVADKIGVSLKKKLRLLDCIEAVVMADGRMLRRPSSFEDFIGNVKNTFPGETDKLDSFFLIMKGLNKETLSSMTNEKMGFLQVPLFMKHYKTRFLDFVFSFSFSSGLQQTLVGFAPWEDISMIAMALYWLQISSMGTNENGFVDIQNALQKTYLDNGGEFLNYLPVEQVALEKDGGYRISWSGCGGSGPIKAKKVVFVSGRGKLSNYGLNIQAKPNPATRYPSSVCFFELEKPLPVNPVPGYIRFRTVEKDVAHRVNLSYLDRPIIKAEYVGPYKAEDFGLIQNFIQRCLARLDPSVKMLLVSFYPPEAIAALTGFDDGVVYSWAQSVPEILSNPIQQLSVRSGVYSLGDWTTGYFYAAEMYFREIIKKQ
jgi:hypothetical protein